MDSAKPYIDQAKQMASETAAVASDKARELASIAQAQGGDTLRQVLCLDYLHCATIIVGVQHLAVICCYMHACSTGLPFVFPHSLHGTFLVLLFKPSQAVLSIRCVSVPLIVLHYDCRRLNSVTHS